MFDISGWAHTYSGKVRDLYIPQGAAAFGSGRVMLVVASDRVSAFDYVLPTPIPDRGKILNQLSVWWFEQLADLVPNHVISLDVPEEVEGRAMIVRQLQMVPVECVARGYITGSGLSEYNATGRISGHSMPEGLRDGDRLPEPLFTPAAKAPVGEHDENITFDEMRRRVGPLANDLRDLTLELYERARQIAAERGLILADTKFEFGLRDEKATRESIVLADEVLTPDSSRYWAPFTPGEGLSPTSFDKQFVRDWLLSAESGWSRESGQLPPALPPEIVEKTRERYLEAFRRLTGTEPRL